MSTYYYVYPFATSGGNTSAVPTEFADATPPGAGLSYQDGYTVNYEQDLLTVPTALPISRGQMNQLFFDITNNIQQYQQHAAPQWVPASANLGVALAYDIYAKVRYNVSSPGTEGAGTLVYTNMVQGNTATPGADNTWIPNGFSISSNVPYSPGVSVPTTITPINITQITVPAGTWAVFGNVIANFSLSNAGVRGWCSLTSATEPDLSLEAATPAQTGGSGATVGSATPVLIVTVTVPTIVYLSGLAQFTSGTVSLAGTITAIPIATPA